MKKKNLNDIITESNIIHNSFYTYDKSIYINCKTNIIITCPKHGDFEQNIHHHLRGQGCPKCKGDKISKTKRINLKDIIKKSELIYSNNIYDYTNINYKNLHNIVELKCNKHNLTFKQELNSHLNGHLGCFDCQNEFKKYYTPSKTDQEIITKLENIHGNIYDYSLVNYKNNRTNIKIICPVHGIFERRLENINIGCLKCNRELNFINKSKIIHNNFYEYNNVHYTNSKTEVIITCPKHGDFKQMPYNHIVGKGCSICNMSQGEKIINNNLIDNNIVFEREKRFKDCKYKNTLPFDFYLSEYNICIEYDGKQHYESIEFFGGEDEFKKRQLKDKIKTEYCKNNNIRLLRLSYNDNIEDIINRYIY